MTEPTFDPKEASGESAMRGSRPLELNEVSLNGDGGATEIRPGEWKRNGGYFRKRILVGKPKDAKPEEVDLGREIQVVFLKVRRRLVERGEKGKIIHSTGEHNAPTNAVTLYEPDTKNTYNGVAKDLRTRFPELRTVQIVYALLLGETKEPELVRLIVKGASLGSEVKAKDVPDFYQYLSSFSGDEHFYQYKTVLTPVEEKGAQTYFALNFTRGEKLNEKQYEFALGKMREVHKNCVEVDTQRAQRIAKDTVVDIVPEGDDVGEETLPGDDINPDDIPF